MKDSIETHHQTCKCGHNKATHYFDQNKVSGNCLAMACNCKRYVFKDDPIPKPAKTGHESWCHCKDCRDHRLANIEDDEEPAPITERMW